METLTVVVLCLVFAGLFAVGARLGLKRKKPSVESYADGARRRAAEKASNPAPQPGPQPGPQPVPRDKFPQLTSQNVVAAARAHHAARPPPPPTDVLVTISLGSGPHLEVTGRPSAPSVPQASSAASFLDKDAWEDWDTYQYAPGMTERKLDGVRLNIKFLDREGQATQRDVDVQKYAHNSKTHSGVIYAFCHLRHARRPFAFSRIRQATDLATGELISDIGIFLDNAYQATGSCQGSCRQK